MLKITKIEQSAATVRFKLEGKVTEQWAALLEEECLASLCNHKTVVLDCAGVNFLDERGVEVLRSLPLDQVKLIGAPGFVTELLHRGGRP